MSYSAYSSIQDRIKNLRKNNLGGVVQPQVRRTSKTTTQDDEEETRKNEEPRKPTSVAERLRIKNQELLTSTERSSDRTSERSSYSSDRNSYSRDKDLSSTRDRTSDRTNKSYTSSSDTGDTRDVQRKLEQANKDLLEYKTKYEKVKKEKEDLELKLKQYKEDIEKMEDLKNDNLRLKDENGALIRVISKLSRTPTSSS